MDSNKLAYAAARNSLNCGLHVSGLPNFATNTVIQEGWVLKKRRKKMQGFARRYFILYQSGLLSYSFEPGQPVRDQISLPHAAISTAPGRKDIHIDSNNATFHMKCLSSEDFTQWMAAFRKFIAPGPDARRSASIRISSRQGTVKLNKSTVIVEEMGVTIAELEDAFAALRDTTTTKKLPSLHRSKSDKDTRPKEGASMFGLFKKGHHHGANEFGAVESPRADYITPSDSSQSAYYERISLAIESLRSQHGILIKSLQSMATLDQSAHASPLLSTMEEEDHAEDQASENFSLPLTRRSKRNSVATTATDSLSEWFDASEGEGAQEFILEDHASPDNGEQTEQPSRIATNDSRSSLGGAEESSIDTDMESEDKGDTQVNPNDSVPSPARGASQVQIVRRIQLPAPVVGDEGSLFAVLKKNVGKDLSTIAFPVTFNEPLTLLQRAAEELEYYDLLNQAAGTSDPVERIQYVAAFAVSSYAHTRHRTGRKGFNPMLAETFEDVRMKFIAEKVRHNPVEMAYHAEGANWELNATSAGKTKFWGKCMRKSLEIIPLGTTHLKIGNDHYQWKKPSSFMRNLMVGTKYLEHVGKMTIENITGHNRCVLEFKQSGYWGSSNVVSGTVHDTSGRVVSQLEGKWDEQFSHAVDSSHLVVLWRTMAWPKHMHEYYGFTAFGITLNEITADIADKLPPTDSRRRTDVRALEEGDLDTAEAEKVRIEELQRERRRNGKEPKPRWFRQEGDEWVYAGGYWEARAKGWKGAKIEPLW